MVKKRKEDFFNYVSNILQKSMLTGIPQIIAAGNWPKRIMRTIIFILCVGGFVYQSRSFMNIYWEYDVVMDMLIETPSEIVRPAFTVCNKLGFKVQKWCAENRTEEMIKLMKEHEAGCMTLQQLQKTSINLCECIPRFCDAQGNLKNWSIINVMSIASLPRNISMRWLLAPHEIIRVCTELKVNDKMEGDCPFEYVLHPAVPYFDADPESCVTMNSFVGRPNHTLEKVSSEGYIAMSTDHHSENYDSLHVETVQAISIHSPYTIGNPFYKGVNLERGLAYAINLRKTVKKLLPPPYKTNCMDYRALWYARGGHGPTNIQECFEECVFNLSMTKHGCMMKQIFWPSLDAHRCPYWTWDDGIFGEARPCTDQCRPACYEEFYTLEVTHYPDTSPRCRKVEQSYDFSKKPDESYVYIYFDRMPTTIYKYSPKYQDIETFSYVGGYVGMWLGISLLAIFDFLETVAAMMKYPFRRWKNFKERRQRIEAVRKFQREL